MKKKTREKQEKSPPTARQLEALSDAGIATEPTSMLAAQNLIAQHYRSRSKRGQRGRRANARRRPPRSTPSRP